MRRILFVPLRIFIVLTLLWISTVLHIILHIRRRWPIMIFRDCGKRIVFGLPLRRLFPRRIPCIPWLWLWCRRR